MVAMDGNNAPPWRSPLAEERDRRVAARRRARLGPGWQTLRAQVLGEEATCRRCPAPATHVDHIVPLARGGSRDRSNLQALCRPCHEAKTVAESAAPLPRRTEIIYRALAGIDLYTLGTSSSGRYPNKGRPTVIVSAEELDFYGVYVPPGYVCELEDRADIERHGQAAVPPDLWRGRGRRRASQSPR
jgi:HNH endonuclease